MKDVFRESGVYRKQLGCLLVTLSNLHITRATTAISEASLGAFLARGASVSAVHGDAVERLCTTGCT